MTKKKGSRLRRYMNVLIRLLSKARDLYVYGMSNCSAHFSYMDATTMVASSARGSDLKDLLKPSSLRSDGSHVRRKTTRSCTVEMGRIDEDKPSDFGNDVSVKLYVYPRTRRVMPSADS